MPAPLAKPIFGVIARTQYGREHLDPTHLHPYVSRWEASPDPAHWFCDRQSGIAIYQPTLLQPAQHESHTSSCLCIRGTLSAPDWGPYLSTFPPNLESNPLNLLQHCIAEGNTAMLRRLQGQFAMACWDGKRRVLWLARDHMGQRCMYMRTDPNFIFFCSELAPLLKGKAFSSQMDRTSVFNYLAFGMPAPGRTLAQNVTRLPAAHALNWEAGSAPVQIRYWSPLHAEAPHEADDAYVHHCREVLENATLNRLKTEETQGIFLSGGVDSTFLAATAKMKGHTLHSYTSEFDDQYGINETVYAEGVANWLEFPHHKVSVSAEDALNNLHEVALSAPEPPSAWAVLTHFKILAQVQQHGIRHMLSGLGADEIFGGYDHFRGYYSRYLRYLKQSGLPPDTDPMEAIMMPESQSARKVLYPGVARIFDDNALKKALHPPFDKWHYASDLRNFYRECKRIKPEAQPMEMMVAHECQHRIPDLLFANFEPIARKMGIEIAYPFLDPTLVQTVCGLSASSRYRRPDGQFSLRLRELMPGFKYAMMQVAKDRVPATIIERPRKSYTAPFGQWLYNPEFANPILARMQKSRFWETGMVKMEYVDEILKRVQPGPNPWVFQLWGLITLTGWYDHYIEGNPS